MLMGSALLFSLSDSQIERPQTRYRQTTTRVHFRFKYMKSDQKAKEKVVFFDGEEKAK